MDNLKEYEKVAKFYERADKIYNRLVKAMFEGEVGGLDTSTVLYVTEMFTAQMLLVVYGEQAKTGDIESFTRSVDKLMKMMIKNGAIRYPNSPEEREKRKKKKKKAIEKYIKEHPDYDKDRKLHSNDEDAN